MAQGLFASYALGLMQTPSAQPDLDTDNIVVALWGDESSGGSPTIGEMETAATNLISELVTATGGNVENFTTHVADLASKTFGSVSAYVFDAADTTITAATTSTETKDLLIAKRAASPLAVTDTIIAFFDLTTPVSPTGVDVKVTWSASGLWRNGAAL